MLTRSAVADGIVPKASRRQWYGLAVVALPCVLYAMDLTVLNIALPAVSAALNPSAAQLLWIVDIYGFVVAGMLITMGALGDRVGRRRLLLIGAAAFAVASIFAAFSRTANMLILSRALLGLSGATFAPATLSLIRNMFHDSRERTTAIGVWVASYSVGGAIGPAVGGLILSHYWWGAVFLISVPVMGVLLIVGPAVLPEYRDRKPASIDWASVALSIAAVLVTVYGVKQLAAHGLAWASAMSIVAGLVLGWVFVRRQTRARNPLVRLDLFRNMRMVTALGTYTLSSFVCVGSALLIGQYMQLVLGLTPFEAGLWTIPVPVAFLLSSSIAPALIRHIPPVLSVTTGLAVGAAGFAILAFLDEQATPLALTIACVIFALGLGPVLTITTDLVVASAPPEDAGVVSAISETSGELGGALGIALLGSLSVLVYRVHLSASVPGDILQGVERASLGEAIQLAHRAGGSAEALLLQAARSAFVEGLHTVALVSAIALAAAATLLWCSSGYSHRGTHS